MKAFDFRLSKVLEYRQLTEEWAKDAYLDARAARLEAETVLLGILTLKQQLLTHVALTIEDMQATELRFQTLDDRESEQRLVINVLADEEGKALADWKERRHEVAALEKLHDRAYEEWTHLMSKEEQAFLDEWTNSRRAA